MRRSIYCVHEAMTWDNRVQVGCTKTVGVVVNGTARDWGGAIVMSSSGFARANSFGALVLAAKIGGRGFATKENSWQALLHGVHILQCTLEEKVENLKSNKRCTIQSTNSVAAARFNCSKYYYINSKKIHCI